MHPLYFLAPEVILTVCGLLLLLWEAFGQPDSRTLGRVCLGSYLVAGICLWSQMQVGVVLWDGLYAWDKLAIYFKAFFLATGFLVTWLALEFEHRLSTSRGEFMILPLFVSSGLLLLASAQDFILLFVGLELVTVGFYILVAYQRQSPTALEAGVKYLVMGGLSTAFLVMGIAHVFGFSGSTQFQVIQGYVEANGISAPFLLGMGFIIVGLGFKIAAVPFHLWAPDVYQGASLPVASFLAIGSKAAGFVLLLRVLDTPFASGLLQERWVPVMAGLAMASLILGNFTALPQRNMRRLMAYSSISHAGFLLIGICANTLVGHTAVLFYLTAYFLGAFVVFYILTVLGTTQRGENLADLTGLNKRSPLLAFAMALAMISLAGLPPLIGFFGKYLVFLSAWGVGQYWLVAVGMLSALAGLYYYIGVVRIMYWSAPEDDETITIRWSARVMLLVLSGLMVILGIWPQPLLAWITATLS
jgi:NADH-quinone oxidoreductase subunit N